MPPELNRLRRAKYFRDFNGIQEHMRHHAAIIRSRFNVVPYALVRWLPRNRQPEKPKGGNIAYFPSLLLESILIPSLIAMSSLLHDSQ